MTFLNVDLEIQSVHDLKPLASELESRATVLRCGEYYDENLLNLEIHLLEADAATRINDLCAIIESLPPSSLHLWQAASRREFDAGFESTTNQERFALTIPAATLQRMANLNASFAITIYPPGPDLPPHQSPSPPPRQHP